MAGVADVQRMVVSKRASLIDECILTFIGCRGEARMIRWDMEESNSDAGLDCSTDGRGYH